MKHVFNSTINMWVYKLWKNIMVFTVTHVTMRKKKGLKQRTLGFNMV